MAYDHSRKIGNEGDVAKHVVLYHCIQHLLKRKAEGEVFVYGDSHAGRPVYVLPETGEWKRGIQVLSRLSSSELRGHPMIEVYRQELVPYQMQAGQRYVGSSEITFRVLRRSGQAYRLHLYETDVNAHDDLVRHFYPWHESVAISQADGYGGVSVLEGADFVLVDPPSLDIKPVSECLSMLSRRGTSFLCWTPRSSAINGIREESEKAVQFREQCQSAVHFPVRWSAPTGAGQNTFGCCLSVSSNLTKIAEEAIGSLVALLSEKGWIRG